MDDWIGHLQAMVNDRLRRGMSAAQIADDVGLEHSFVAECVNHAMPAMPSAATPTASRSSASTSDVDRLLTVLTS